MIESTKCKTGPLLEKIGAIMLENNTNLVSMRAWIKPNGHFLRDLTTQKYFSRLVELSVRKIKSFKDLKATSMPSGHLINVFCPLKKEWKT